MGGFTTFDISTGVKLNSQLSIGAGISNVFNVKQLEFVGSPSIGRLFSVELKAHIPNSKNSFSKFILSSGGHWSPLSYSNKGYVQQSFNHSALAQQSCKIQAQQNCYYLRQASF